MQSKTHRTIPNNCTRIIFQCHNWIKKSFFECRKSDWWDRRNGIHRSIITDTQCMPSMKSLLSIVRTVSTNLFVSLRLSLLIRIHDSSLLFDGYIHCPIGYGINTPYSSLHSGRNCGLFGFTVSNFFRSLPIWRMSLYCCCCNRTVNRTVSFKVSP